MNKIKIDAEYDISDSSDLREETERRKISV